MHGNPRKRIGALLILASLLLAAARVATHGPDVGSGARAPGFDPVDHIAGYEEWAPAFAEAGEREEVERIKRLIDRELRDRRRLEAAGPLGWLSVLGMVLLSPELVLLVAGIALVTTRLAILLPAGALAGGSHHFLMNAIHIVDDPPEFFAVAVVAGVFIAVLARFVILRNVRLW